MRGIEVVVGGFMSIDGKVAPANRVGHTFTEFMTPAHQKILHKIRSAVDAVLVGVDTIIADDPSLTVRAVQGKNPLRVIIDSKARTPLHSKILHTNEAPTVIFVTSKAPLKKVKFLQSKGAEVIIAGTAEKVNLQKLMSELKSRGITRLLVEGGSTVRWSFFKENLVDEVFVWIMPYVWGGKAAPTLVDGDGFLKTEEAVALQLKSVDSVGKILILWFSVKR